MDMRSLAIEIEPGISRLRDENDTNHINSGLFPSSNALSRTDSPVVAGSSRSVGGGGGHCSKRHPAHKF